MEHPLSLPDSQYVNGRRVQWVALAIAIVLPLLLRPSQNYLLTLVFIYAILAFSAIIPLGYLDQLILSQGAFFGLGAYTYVKLTQANVPSWIAVAIGTGFVVVVAYVLAKPSIRARGIYLGIITLAFNELFTITVTISNNVLGGTEGLPAPDLYFPAIVTDLVPIDILYYYLALGVFLLVLLFIRWIASSEIGQGFKAIQEDEQAAEAIGIDTKRYRIFSFLIAGFVCGLAGGLFAPINGYVSPTMFDLTTTVDIILAGVLGGITVPLGGLVGSAIVIGFPEIFRFVSEIRYLLYGIMLVVLLIYLPDGILGLFEDWRSGDEKE